MKKWVTYIVVNFISSCIFFALLHGSLSFFASTSSTILVILVLALIPLGYGLLVREKLKYSKVERAYFCVCMLGTYIIVGNGFIMIG